MAKGNRPSQGCCNQHKGCPSGYIGYQHFQGQSRGYEKDLNESLERLNTDYIDLYFLHRDNPDVPVEELLDTLEEARIAGKIRYYGCSNWALSRIMNR